MQICLCCVPLTLAPRPRVLCGPESPILDHCFLILLPLPNRLPIPTRHEDGASGALKLGPLVSHTTTAIPGFAMSIHPAISLSTGDSLSQSMLPRMNVQWNSIQSQLSTGQAGARQRVKSPHVTRAGMGGA